MDKTTEQLAEVAGLGGDALEILENKAFINAFNAIQDNLYHDWLHSDYADTTLRENLWQKLNLLRQIRQTLLQTIAEAEKAKSLLQG